MKKLSLFKRITLVLAVVVVAIAVGLLSMVPNQFDNNLKSAAIATVRNVSNSDKNELVKVKIIKPTKDQLDLLDFGYFTEKDLNEDNVEILKRF